MRWLPALGIAALTALVTSGCGGDAGLEREPAGDEGGSGGLAGLAGAGFGGEGALAGAGGAAGDAGVAAGGSAGAGSGGTAGGVAAGGGMGGASSGGGTGGASSSGGAGGTPPTTPEPPFTGEMVFATVNIGREYGTKAEVAAVIDHVGDVIGSKSGPKFIGWQEIDEGDPCGSACEIDSIHARFATAAGWTTHRPKGKRPDGGSELVKVPITSKGSSDFTARAEFASPGWAGVSPTRFVTVVRYQDRGLAVLDTHFIAGAWSCKSEVAKRKDYWKQAWQVLKDEVKKEHDLGRNLVVTGDLNRPRAANGCNPAWDPTSLHPKAEVVGGEGIDYIFAVPAAGHDFVISTAGGAKQKGSIHLGIDGHEGHWVVGRFVKN